MLELLSDRVANNLMYIEAVAEVTGRWGGRGEGSIHTTHSHTHVTKAPKVTAQTGVCVCVCVCECVIQLNITTFIPLCW